MPAVGLGLCRCLALLAVEHDDPLPPIRRPVSLQFQPHAPCRTGEEAARPGQASPTCPFWIVSSLPQRASRPLVTLRCLMRLLPSAASHAHSRCGWLDVYGGGLAVRLAVLRAAWVISVLGAVADGTARGAAGRAAGGMAACVAACVAGGMAGVRVSG